MHLTNVQNTLRRARYTRFCVCANHNNLVVFEDDIFLDLNLKTVSKSIQKMSQSRQAGCVTPTSRLKDSRAKKLGVLPRTLWSNDQDPALLVIVFSPHPPFEPMKINLNHPGKLFFIAKNCVLKNYFVFNVKTSR